MNNDLSHLAPGDTVMIVAPAGFLKPDAITFAIEVLRGWGLNVIVGDNVFKQHSVFAGTDMERASDLQKALDTPSVNAVICARGGYGSIRTLALIDWTLFLQSPKLICGFSDITTIHSRLSHANIPSLHSIMPINFTSASTEAHESLRRALFGEPLSYSIISESLNRPGYCTGTLTGGNLSILMSIKGTEYEPDYEGKVLFIEDVGETKYHIDRMMQNLKLTVLPKIAGLIVGQFTEMRDGRTAFGTESDEIIADACSGFSFPICFGFPAGHITDNRCLIMNTPLTMFVGSNTEIRF